MRSIVTISSDYRGPAAEFALVAPAPHVPGEDRIHSVAPEAQDLADDFLADTCARLASGAETLARLTGWNRARST